MLTGIQTLTQHLVEAPLAIIRASNLLWYDVTSFTHLDLENYLSRSSHALSGLVGIICGQLFSALSRDFQLGSSQGSVWAPQGHSKSCN